MANLPKATLLENLRKRFGEVHKLESSQSLFRIGNDAARIYIRYSRVHAKGRTFFGLRQVDLHQLEGHNSFLCFLLDDGTPPLFIPYSDFEDVFRSSQPARDGQYKVQLLSLQQGLELYVARQGRFNVDGYVGFDGLPRSIEAARLRQTLDLAHSQIQTLLASIGHSKGYEVYVPENDVTRLDWSMAKKFALRRSIPAGFDSVARILSEIDVVWITSGRSRIEALFEVEHSTPIYSGLLRLNDILLTEPKISRFSIVSNDARRARFSREIRRPTFTKSGLSECVSFLEYANVVQWHSRIAGG